MARDRGVEFEITLAGKSRHGTAHGKAVADRHNADNRLVQFLDERHIGEDIRIAHVIERGLVVEMEDEAVGVAQSGKRRLR